MFGLFKNKVIGKTSSGKDVHFHAKPEGMTPEERSDASSIHHSERDKSNEIAEYFKDRNMGAAERGYRKKADHHAKQANIYSSDLKKGNYGPPSRHEAKSMSVPEPRKAPIKMPSIPNPNMAASATIQRKPKAKVGF